MEIIKDEKLMWRMIRKYHMEELFTDIRQYLPGMKLVRFPRKIYIYSYPESRKYAYFLLSGKLHIYAVAENGEQMLIRYCEDFIFMGDMELLGYNSHPNIAETLSECMMLAIDIALMREKLLNDPKFLRFLCFNLMEKWNHFMKYKFHNKTINARQRVASHILQAGGETGFFKENLRRTAVELDISYRHLHRILAELVDEGTLMRSNGGYEIVSMKRLEDLYWKYEKE